MVGSRQVGGACLQLMDAQAQAPPVAPLYCPHGPCPSLFLLVLQDPTITLYLVLLFFKNYVTQGTTAQVLLSFPFPRDKHGVLFTVRLQRAFPFKTRGLCEGCSGELPPASRSVPALVGHLGCGSWGHRSRGLSGPRELCA